MNILEDDALMAQVKEGQVRMLAVLFERHHRRLYNFFLRLTGERQASEDLVQELFLRILKYRLSFSGESPFSAWMFQIARNLHIDHLRKRHPESSLEDIWEREPASREASPLQVAEGEQEAELLHRALERLSLRKREVLLLSRFQDLSYREIAQLQACSVEAVKVQVHRAIKDLREKFMQLKGGFA